MEDDPWMIHDGLLYLVTMVISIVTLYCQRAYFFLEWLESAHSFGYAIMVLGCIGSDVC